MNRKYKELLMENKSLRDENDLLQNQVAGFRVVVLRHGEAEQKFKEDLEKERKRYSFLLEKYISMMERAARIYEQREAD